MSDMLPSPRRIAIEKQNAEQRRVALERLNAEAETADAHRAREIQVQGRLIAEALRAAKAPYEEAWLAGKASVVAARRLGRLLAELSNRPLFLGSTGKNGIKGRLPSPRTQLGAELGLSPVLRRNILRLAQVSDPDFQRYIQSKETIPSIHNALCRLSPDRMHPSGGTRTRKGSGGWSIQRRNRAGVQVPSNPSLDEGYSLIVRALGHLCSSRPGGGAAGELARDLGQAIDHLYAAEDLLKPYRAGYDGTGRKAA